jgi:hypothetical protein
MRWGQRDEEGRKNRMRYEEVKERRTDKKKIVSNL